MVESFGEYASPTDTIAAILGTYPFSIGLFRELIQNSDDAKATKQVFVLDARTHPMHSLFHANLGDAQGPSLLAYNDALFSQEDWEALQSIHRSSKKTDTSKIGKYGIGFRSCYHVTDTPQILSGSSLAILDPQHIFSESGGAKFDVNEYPNHGATFDFFQAGGSVIRLPLRRKPSVISKQIVSPQDVQTLFADFIREEFDIALLFLRHVKRIEIWHIDEVGNRSCLAGVSITKDATTEPSFLVHVGIDSISSKSWRVFQSSFSQAESATSMNRRLGRDVHQLLEKHKLFPTLAIAVPLSEDEAMHGRLFTYLPLPIRTGFPCHVHGLFALTQSRQNLSNKSEVGIVRGSDDSVLIEWNQMLFDEYLPRTWATLLPILIQSDGFSAERLYSAWPPCQPHVNTGDSLYWRNLPANVLSAVVAYKAAVWPLIPRSHTTGATFQHIYAVHVASNSINVKAIQAMADAGMSIIQPPVYIQDMIDDLKVPYLALVPHTAHAALLEHIATVQEMNQTACLALLEFLLSSGDLTCVVDLPIVPLVNRQLVPLEQAASNGHTYTLLDADTQSLFGQFDEHAVSLKMMNPLTQDLFVRNGPGLLNVAHLVPEKVIQYLKKSPFGLDFSVSRQMSSVNEVIILWLSKFWIWVGSWKDYKDALMPMICGFYLLPSRTTQLVAMEEGIFVPDKLEPYLVPVLQQLGISFLHELFSQAARDVVKIFPGALRLPGQDIHSVLDRLNIPHDFLLDKERSDMLCNFAVQSILDFCRVSRLKDIQQRALRSLPIFPILLAAPNLVKPEKTTSRLFSSFQSKAPKTNTIKTVGPIRVDNTVYGVTPSTSALLPLARDITFLDGSNIDLVILLHLQPENNVPLSEVDVVGLALEHFGEQSKFLQTAFMEYMVQHRESLPPRLLKILQQVKFIPVLDGSMQSPEHVVDPASPLTALYLDSGDRVPRSVSKGEDDVAVVLKQLRILGVLRATLSNELILERIQHISAIRDTKPQGSKALAIRLIDLLYTTGFDATQLEIPADAKWVPTNRGMLGYAECLDRGLHRPELFDEVFPLVDDAVNVSPPLRMALGWDKPLSLGTLTQQMKKVMAQGKPEVTYRKMRIIIKELSQRELSEDELLTLRNLTSEEDWIPISHHHAASTNHTVFHLPLPLPGFYEIPLAMSDRQDVREFLEKMGCVERPGTDILVTELKRLDKTPPSNEKLQATLMLLKALPPNLTEEERAEMLVPDTYCNLRPSKDVFFNDIGDRAYLEAGDVVLAHPRLDEHIAKRLHMSRLGLKFLHLKNPGLDMGEKLTTTIRNVLKQYTEQQTLTEFLANASDAGASNFKILVDDCQAPVDHLLSPSMAPFQRCPSLVISNDSVFTQKDFDGICRTGVGGKEGRTNTIGQFGLGALSMFHFTELAMIVSSDKVLFLNPSKTHLPLDDWASLLLPLQQMRRLYPDHLAALDGLFGFELSSAEDYDGTLFRLPLRNESHVNEGSILQTPRRSEYVRDHIVRPYWRSAQQSLLFSKITSISTFYRPAPGRIVRGWSLHVDRDNVVVEDEFTQHTLRITGYVSADAKPAQDIWKVVMSTRPISALPAEFLFLTEPHRLRSPIVAGFAARTTSQKWQSGHNLFSTLPLPMTTTLPVHLTASFILTPDRRHIRFDDYDNLESKYNRWLLSVLAPPLYLYLLEMLYRELGHNELWWPGNTTQQDNVTRVLVDAFYSQALPNSERQICASYFQAAVQIKPSEAVLLGQEPEDVTEVLKHLRVSRFVKLPVIIRSRCAAVMQVLDQSVLASDLALYAFRFISLYEKGTVTLDQVQTIVRYLQEKPETDILYLPLIPLANGTLAPIHPDTYKTRYYVWKPSSPDRQVFDTKDLVHPDFDASYLLDKAYNVCKLEGSEVSRLLREKLPETPTYTFVDARRDEWMNKFWKEYGTLGMDPDFNASEFPLIPTIRLGHYVSMKACKTQDDVILVGVDEPAWLASCLDRLGASVVRRHDRRLPAIVSNTLQSLPTFKFDKVLRYLNSVDMKSKFSSLAEEPQKQFAQWCTNEISHTSLELFPVAMKLPIWPSTSAASLLPATDVSMLPYNFPPDVVVAFVKKPCVEFSQGLRHLGIQPLSLNDLWDQLDLPTFLNPQDSPSYKRFITALLTDTSFTRGKVLLPNGRRLLVESDTLYGREPLFVAAFGSTSLDHFVLEEYIDLEARLVNFGLKVPTTLDLDTFVLCATSIHEDVSGADREQRARLVFQAYCEDLPLRLTFVGLESSWRQLDRLRFIPRQSIRQHNMRIEEYSPYTKSLPPVVAPCEILLPEYEAIAWTQRALFSTRPVDRVLIANPSLGKPTIGEVIAHLRVLALEVARDHTGSSFVLSDLTAVYKWLDEHQDEVGEELIALHQERLFLNVDNPSTDVWLWTCADEMFLNITDGGDLKAVRKFLQPYKDLLYVSGVEEIMNPPAPETVFTSMEAQYARLRKGYDEMRQAEQLTDVVFVTEDEERFPAHRSFLAPMSEYLRDLFCGDFTEAGPASSAEPIEVGVDYPAACVKVVMDFIYTGVSPDFGDIGLSVLLDILDLSLYWGFLELNDATQAHIIAGSFINPATYGDILQRATILDAKFLLDACEYYERENRDAIERLKGGSRQPRKNPRHIPQKAKSNWNVAAATSEAGPSGANGRARRTSGVRRMMHRISSTWSRRRTSSAVSPTTT